MLRVNNKVLTQVLVAEEILKVFFNNNFLIIFING